MQNPRHGQSLIEALIAISLLTVGFRGVATLLTQSLHVAKAVSDQTTATYLAAEGIELAKNLIDHDVYLRLAGQPVPWGNCFTKPGGESDMELDYSSLDCSKPYFPDHFLRFDPATGLYSYALSSPVVTNFRREIRASINPFNVDEIIVNSRVRWTTGGASQVLDLEDHFYNWRP